MKKLYYLILTLFTVTCCNAADSPPPGTPTDDDDSRSTAMLSETGSAGSRDFSRLLLRPETYVLPKGVGKLDRDELVGVLADAAQAYAELHVYTDELDTRIENLLTLLISKLKLPQPPEQDSQLVRHSLTKLGESVTAAVLRLKNAQKDKKLAEASNEALNKQLAALNASIAELTERNKDLEQECATYQPLIAAKLNELTANEATIADLTRKVELAHSRTKELFEQISTLEEELASARAASERAKNGDTERELVAEKARADAEKKRADAEKARADAEKVRADNATAEKNRLQAALAAAQSRSDAAAGGDESTPLVVRRLNTGDTPAAVRGGAQPKKDEGCPCLVM